METLPEETVPLSVQENVGIEAYRAISSGKFTDEKICGTLWTVNAFEKLHYMLLTINDRAKCDYVPLSGASLKTLGKYFETIQAAMTTYHKCCAPTVSMRDRKTEWELYVDKKLKVTHFNRHRHEEEEGRFGVHIKHAIDTLDVLDKMDEEGDARDLELLGAKMQQSLVYDLTSMQTLMSQLDNKAGRLGYHDSQIKFMIECKSVLENSFALLNSFFAQCAEEGTLGEFVSKTKPENASFWLCEMFPAPNNMVYTAADLVQQMGSLCLDITFQTKMAQNFNVYSEWCKHFVDSSIFNYQTWACGSANMMEMSSNFVTEGIFDMGISKDAHSESLSQLSTAVKMTLGDMNVSEEALVFGTLKIVDPIGYAALVPTLDSVIISEDEMSAQSTTKDLYYRTLAYIASASPELQISLEKQTAASAELQKFATSFTKQMKYASDMFHAFKAIVLRKHAKAVTMATLACTAVATNVIPLAWNESIQKAFGSVTRPAWHVEYIDDVLLPIVRSNQFKLLMTYISVDAILSRYARIDCEFSPLTYKMMKSDELENYIESLMETEAARIDNALSKFGYGGDIEQVQMPGAPDVVSVEKTKLDRIQRPALPVQSIEPRPFASAASQFESRQGPIPFLTTSVVTEYDRIELLVPHSDPEVLEKCPNAFEVIKTQALIKKIQASNSILAESLSGLPDWGGSGTDTQRQTAVAFYGVHNLNDVYKGIYGDIASVPATDKEIMEKCTGLGQFQGLDPLSANSDQGSGGFNAFIWAGSRQSCDKFLSLSNKVFKATGSHSTTAMFLYRALQLIYIALPYRLMKKMFNDSGIETRNVTLETDEDELLRIDDAYKDLREKIQKQYRIDLVKMPIDLMIMKMTHHYQNAVADTNRARFNPVGIVGTLWRNFSPNQDYDDPMLGGMQTAFIDLITVGTSPWTYERISRTAANQIVDFLRKTGSTLRDSMSGNQSGSSSTPSSSSSSSAQGESGISSSSSAQDEYYASYETVKKEIAAVEREITTGLQLQDILTRVPLPGCKIAVVASEDTPTLVNLSVSCPTKGNPNLYSQIEVLDLVANDAVLSRVQTVNLEVLKGAANTADSKMAIKVDLTNSSKGESVKYIQIPLATVSKRDEATTGAGNMPDDATQSGLGNMRFFTSSMGAMAINFGVELASISWRVRAARAAIANEQYGAKNKEVVDIWKSKYVMGTSVMLLQTFSPYGVANVTSVPSSSLGNKIDQSSNFVLRTAARAVYRAAQKEITNVAIEMFTGVFFTTLNVGTIELANLASYWQPDLFAYSLCGALIAWGISYVLSVTTSVVTKFGPQRASFASTIKSVMAAFLFAILAFSARYGITKEYFM